jgi:nickel-dependent lactate racemase
MKASLPYGAGLVTAEVPDARLRAFEILALTDPVPSSDPASLVEAALANPIGARPLGELAASASNAVIVVDDVTRPTPVSLLLPAVVRQLTRGGLKREDITVLVALGTHRFMTRAELQAKLGEEMLESLTVVQHDYRDPAQLVDLGHTPSGTPVVLNRLVRESDLTVGIGNIVPHRYCGWAGGAKIIQPGVSGEATTAGTHLMITKDPDARLGVVENRVRHEIEAVADQTSLAFIVNTVLTVRGEVLGVVAGDFRAAFRSGIEMARQVYAVPARGQADIVLTSGYPAELNFWQAGKALYAADLLVRDGGVIVLAAPCPDGMGEHDEFTRLLSQPYEAIEGKISLGEIQDLVGAAAALAVALVRRRARIFLVSDGVNAGDADLAGLVRFDSLQAAVDAALETTGSGAVMAVLREGAEALPVFPAPPGEAYEPKSVEKGRHL